LIEAFNADRDVFMHDRKKNTFVKDLSDGDSLRDIFLVKKKQRGISRNGSPYLTLTLCDKSGDIEAKVWENADSYEGLFLAEDLCIVKSKF
jgi:3'-5' exoribonuclease